MRSTSTLSLSSADASSPLESSVQAPATSASVQVHAANHFRFCITPPKRSIPIDVYAVATDERKVRM